MIDLQEEFEATGYTSWINADLYPNGKIYTQEYTHRNIHSGLKGKS